MVGRDIENDLFTSSNVNPFFTRSFIRTVNTYPSFAPPNTETSATPGTVFNCLTISCCAVERSVCSSNFELVTAISQNWE